ncbi:TetR-like C-terminal domain-containing protein [Pseudonocardia sp. GCM10023141]|uniref:TetR-like C-terminal domain-containing protein n=1 Tax=Pseudonocardia sp. GCM10023141 TaxID=3252653 RepID=UPI0036182B65
MTTAEAGVHESSIYRRWGTRENLMVEALLEDAAELAPIPDTGSVRDDLIIYITQLVAFLNSDIGDTLDRSLASGGDDPPTRQVRDHYWLTRFRQSTQIIQRAISRGELPEYADPRRAIEMLVGPLHMKVLLTREPLDPALPEQLVDTLLHGLMPRP